MEVVDFELRLSKEAARGCRMRPVILLSVRGMLLTLFEITSGLTSHSPHWFQPPRVTRSRTQTLVMAVGVLLCLSCELRHQHDNSNTTSWFSFLCGYTHIVRSMVVKDQFLT